MALKETCWQAILRIMADGKPRRYAQIADDSGFQVNTVERYCYEINTGKHGQYRIETEPEPGKSTVLARLVSVMSTTVDDNFIKLCRDRMAAYPDDHNQRAKIETMIENYQRTRR